VLKVLCSQRTIHLAKSRWIAAWPIRRISIGYFGDLWEKALARGDAPASSWFTALTRRSKGMQQDSHEKGENPSNDVL
jgi:hypothetical protein